MELKHIGLACRTEKDADRFYGELLGLEKSERKAIPGTITLPLFGVHGGLDAFYYSGGGLQVEVFITGETPGRIAHACLAVDDLEALTTRARESGFTILEIPKANGRIIFLEDADANRFEIKRVQS